MVGQGNEWSNRYGLSKLKVTWKVRQNRGTPAARLAERRRRGLPSASSVPAVKKRRHLLASDILARAKESIRRRLAAEGDARSSYLLDVRLKYRAVVVDKEIDIARVRELQDSRQKGSHFASRHEPVRTEEPGRATEGYPCSGEPVDIRLEDRSVVITEEIGSGASREAPGPSQKSGHLSRG